MKAPQNPPAAIPASRPQDSTQALVRRLLRDHVRHHVGRIAFAIVCMAVAAAATAGNAWMMQPALDKVFLERNETYLYIVPLVVLVFAVLKGATSYGHEIAMTFVGQRIIAELQKGMFAHLMRADLAFFHANATGTLISRFTYDVQMLREALSKALTGIAKDMLTLVALVSVMFYMDPRLAAVSFFVFPASVLPILWLGRRMRQVSRLTQEEIGGLTTVLEQSFQGARHVKAYGMEAHEASRAERFIETVFGLIYRASKVRTASRPIMETLGGIAVAAVIFYGGHRVIAGDTTPGAFFSFVTALLLAYQPVKNLSNLNASLQQGLAAAERIFAMLDLEPEIRDRPGAAELADVAGEIRFADVRFAYGPDAPALDGIDLVVPAGHTVALVGPSGAGKSTILNLIPRFYDASGGAVTIDGTDVRDVTIASLRANIALVSQEVSLFDDSIRANIAYGRVDATDMEIEQAARNAAAHEFIVALPQGYDTRVGEQGVKLSGGQRQRISIARAMLKNAPILLLDEATSALDTESERHVQAALARLMVGRTTLVIAHRLSTVTTADKIVVIDGGRVVEAGTNEALLAEGGLYARLHALQFAADIPAASPPAGTGRRPAAASA